MGRAHDRTTLVKRYSVARARYRVVSITEDTAVVGAVLGQKVQVCQICKRVFHRLVAH
jgi:hypothetical protein